jgi:hypothetical protein
MIDIHEGFKLSTAISLICIVLLLTSPLLILIAFNSSNELFSLISYISRTILINIGVIK